MQLTYDMVEKVGKEQAEVLIPAAQLPFNVLHKLNVANPAHDLVTAIFEICWVTDVYDNSRQYPSIVGNDFAIETESGAWTTMPLTAVNVQALEADIQEAANA